MKFRKILSIVIIFLLLFNFIIASSVHASDVELETPEEKEEREQMEEADAGGGFLDGVVGILTWFLRLILRTIASAAMTLTAFVAKSDGLQEGAQLTEGNITPADIIFNRLNIVDINFFNISGSSTIDKIKVQVAQWYYIIRILAIMLLLCILIYVGIRAAISTVASDKAKYKQMIVDWLVGFILLFVLHYIMVITIYANNELVSLFSGIEQGSATFSSAVQNIYDKSLAVSATVGIGATLVYIMIVVITITFLIMYIKRMITLAFLIVISPIITVTYSLDRMGDGKSQALNTWLKEFIYNILIQPFHCILYLVFVTTSLSLLNGTMAGMILAILMMSFTLQAEGIIKRIFGFANASTLGSALTTAAGVYGAVKVAQGLGDKAKKGANVAKATRPNAPNKQKASGGSSGGSSGGASGGGGKVPNPTITNKNAAKTPKPSLKQKFNNTKVGQLANKVGQSKVGRALKGPAKITGKAFKAVSSPKMVGAVLGAGIALGAGKDDLATVAGATYAGYKMGGAIQNSATEKISQHREKRRKEAVLSTAYNNMNAAWGVDRTKDITAELLKDPENLLDYAKGEKESDVDYKARMNAAMGPMLTYQGMSMGTNDEYNDISLYAQSLYANYYQYQSMGEKSPDKKINDTIDKISKRENNPNKKTKSREGTLYNDDKD